ncbi:MAG: class D sortase [Chloroflexi bacterium]|nr:class D sortase [Chloroflexota bacterium]
MKTQRPRAELEALRLRKAFMEAQRAARRARMEYYRRTGRVVLVTPDIPPGDLLAEVPGPADAPPVEAKPRRSWLDRVLLAVEILAVVGLFLVLAHAFGLVRALNEEIAQALAPPTPTATPWLRPVVLPSGHTPPNAPGGARPNEAEIPEHLRPYLQAYYAALTLPTPSPEQAIRIRIPAIGVDAPIVMGDDWEQLKKGVGQHIGSANPGQPGNLVLSAHNDIYGEIFRDLDKLQPGDKIYIHTHNRVYTYVVTEIHIVEPTDVEWMMPTDEPVVTLISCYPYMVDNQRIIVRGRLVEE